MAPKCVCGKEFGNEGAKASHQAHCDEYKAQEAEQAAPQPDPQPPQQPAQQPPAQSAQPVPAQQQGQGHQQAPATMDSQQALQVGIQGGQSLAALSSDDPERKAQGLQEFTSMVAGGIAQYGQQRASEMQAGAQRAKQTDELRASDQYPRCPECNGQIVDIPDEQEFRCPHAGCGTMLERV